MKTFTYLIIMCSCMNLWAQPNHKKGDRLLASKAYTEAASWYNEVLSKNDIQDTNILLKAADANYYIENNREALQLYQKAHNLSEGLNAPHIYRYYQCVRAVRDYTEADKLMLDFLKKESNTVAYQQYKMGMQEFEELANDTTPSRYSLTNLEVNTEYSEFAPVMYEGQVIFASSRPGASKELYAWNQQPYLSMFIANKQESGQLDDVKVFSKQVSSDYHDATLTISKKDSTVFFARSKTQKNQLVLDQNRNNNFELFRGKIKEGKITEVKPLFFNSTDYSVGHPALSPDGKYLFFASDMPGGHGGADLYYCKIFEDGVLSTPKNLGGKINTWGNDFFPHVSEGMLYFASDGQIGFGGLDLYVSEIMGEDDFSTPKNLGKKVNTSFDDFAIFFNEGANAGYLTSNRIDGKGDDDLYYFTRRPLRCDQYVFGNVKDQKDNQYLSEVNISIKDDAGNLINSVLTDSIGNFTVQIPCHLKLAITANKTSYFDKTKVVKTDSLDQERIGPINFTLENAEDRITKDEQGVEKIIMDPIFFPYDKATITPQAATVLEKAVELMNFYPNMVIKIEAHTDSRGSRNYNRDLSDRRAKATQRFLYTRGIAENRVESAIGYGESRLLNHCKDGVSCTETEHKKNRRSDFIILKR